MSIGDWYTYRVRLRKRSWTIKRPWCWLFGHDWEPIKGTETRPGYNTHLCARCLKFKRLETP